MDLLNNAINTGPSRGDQVNNVYINRSVPISPHHLPLNDNLSRPPLILDHTYSIRTSSLVSPICPSSNAVVAIESSIGLIVEITAVLIDRGVPSNIHLVPELKLLQKTLILNELAIQAYSNRPLGQNLANAIIPAVEQCHEVLEELSNKIGGTWLDNLIGTSDIWGTIWRNVWYEEELTLLKARISHTRIPLGKVLLALNSVSWVELGDELDAGHVPLQRFHDSLIACLPSLSYIKVDAVRVVNHLGEIIPVPILFCSTWEEFNYIINGRCRDRPGSRFIQRGDYEVMRPTDGQIIKRSEFVVESGMTLEMTIIMRQRTTNQNNKCPRCDNLNLNATADNGWTECGGCPAKFQVTADEGGEENGTMHNNEEDEEGEGRHEGSGEEPNEKNDEGVQDTVLALQRNRPKRRIARRRANNENPRPQDDDGREFCRIRLICTNDSVIEIIDPTPCRENIFTENSPATPLKSDCRNERIIGIMGPPGAGKSEFIQVATGGNGQAVGHGLRFYTADIRSVNVAHPTSRQNFAFVEIPGFDDTHKSDTEILRTIAKWLVHIYEANLDLAGIIYLHRISDNRMCGSHLKNLEIFVSLCGQEAMPNVIIATTMWSKVSEEVGAERENELRNNFWKEMLDVGCRTERFAGTHESAWHIVDSIAMNYSKANILLSSEMAEGHLGLGETKAGITLYRQMEQQIKDLKSAGRRLQEQAERQANALVVEALKSKKAEIDKKIAEIIGQLRQLTTEDTSNEEGSVVFLGQVLMDR